MIKYLWKKWFNNTGVYFYINFINIPKFFKELHYFLKTGLVYEATYNHDMYISEHILKCLREYRKVHIGYPVDFKDEKEWNETLDEMIKYLEIMLNNNNNSEDIYGMGILYNSARNRFFELYSRCFNYLWD